MATNLSIIVLAAGQSKRMKSDTSKVLHQLAGVPLLERVVQTARQLTPHNIFVVYGNHGSQLPEKMPHLNVQWVEQPKQLGTGHAVLQALPHCHEKDTVLVLYGDVPLISIKTLQKLLAATQPDALGILTTVRQNPHGYGRIMRDQHGAVIAIVEQKDLQLNQVNTKEINTGILVATAQHLKEWLPSLKNKNAQGEYYLTDIIALASAQKCPIITITTETEEETQGVNDRVELARLERYYQLHQARQLMLQGVTLMDPHRFDLRGQLTVSQDVTFDINTLLEGQITIGPHCVIGPHVVLRNVTLGANVIIHANCIIENAIIKDHCVIGPFARIRPDTELEEGVHVGNFVELKKSHVGKDSKIPHLSYIGDANIGKKVNIGAGVITCNYNGVTKSVTTIKDGAFVGSDSQLVAPVIVGENAYIGSGSTITKDAPDNQLTLARARQTTIANWKKPEKNDK